MKFDAKNIQNYDPPILAVQVDSLKRRELLSRLQRVAMWRAWAPKAFSDSAHVTRTVGPCPGERASPGRADTYRSSWRPVGRCVGGGDASSVIGAVEG